MASAVLVKSSPAPAFRPHKPGLIAWNDHPLCLETPPHLLDDDVTPTHRLFVRNNGRLPTGLSATTWRLAVDGAVERPLSLSLAELPVRFETVTLQLQLECAGNGRGLLDDPPEGEPWRFGAVGCPFWTGVRLKDVLEQAGLRHEAIYTAHYGADAEDDAGHPLSRGVPIEKALDPSTLLVWAVNGRLLSPEHGFPLRLVVPGWAGSCSHKWLTRIRIRDREHDGPRMTGFAYREPLRPLRRETVWFEGDLRPIGSMPVRSIVTFPADGAIVPADRPFQVRGHAWAGDRTVGRVLVSLNGGGSWTEAELDPPSASFVWQRWRLAVQAAEPGRLDLVVRAVDDRGESQPLGDAPWNPGGYLNNKAHRVTLRAV